MRADEIDDVKPLLEKSRQKPYRFLLSEVGGDLDGLWMREMTDLVASNEGDVFITFKAGAIVGAAACGHLPWETRIFGKAMGVVKYLVVEPEGPEKQEIAGGMLDEVIAWARRRGIQFLLCKPYSDDMLTIHALEEKGFLLMDTQLDYVYDSRRCPLDSVAPRCSPQGVAIRLARESDMEGLASVARAAFREHMGRFHADGNIPRDQATRVYEEWIRSSCAGYADWVVVAEVDGRIAGYSVWKKPSVGEQALRVRLGHYSIGAVHPDYGRMGLFTRLTYEGMRLLSEEADWIHGPTHVNNYSVQRGYARLRWRICDARHSLHKWL